MKKEEKNNENCNDKNCPFHGNLRLRGRSFVGVVTSDKMAKTATIEWTLRKYIPKYERYERRKTKIHAHNPECINAEKGDKVELKESRPLSKTKNFVIIKKFGKDIGSQLKQNIKQKEREKIEKKIEKHSDEREIKKELQNKQEGKKDASS